MVLAARDPVAAEFMDALKKTLRDYLPENIRDEVSIDVMEVLKNNDVKRPSVVIRHPDSNCAPNIYLESYIEDLRNGIPIEDSLAEIAGVYMMNSEVEKNFDLDTIKKFDFVKDMLGTKVINLNDNKEFLENVPHKVFGDLAVIAQIHLPHFKDGNATITISNDLMKSWDVPFNEIIVQAQRNDLEKSPITMRSIVDALRDMMGPDAPIEEMMLMDAPPFFVLSTEDGFNGAKYLANEALVDYIKEQFGVNVIVIPSSIHEILLIPVTENTSMDLSQYTAMVQDVNATNVSPEERLSDHVYVLDIEARTLSYEKNGEMVVEQYKAAEVKKPEKAKQGVKSKLKEGQKKSKEAAVKEPKAPTKKKEEVLS